METARFENFHIHAIYTGSKKADWSDKTENWSHHRVIVKNMNSHMETDFDFWASIAKPRMTTRNDILSAFYCFVSDAISGDMTFKEFCSEFGYDEDSRRAEKTWRACVKAHDKLKHIYSGDIYDLANRLQEIAG